MEETQKDREVKKSVVLRVLLGMEEMNANSQHHGRKLIWEYQEFSRCGYSQVVDVEFLIEKQENSFELNQCTVDHYQIEVEIVKTVIHILSHT